MPKYLYKCQKCDIEREIYHSMSEKLKTCGQILGNCGPEGILVRVPSRISIKRQNDDDRPKKIGSVTEKHIKDAKEELEKEKKDMIKKRKEYKNE